MESCLAQVLQKDVGKRLQVGQELIDYFSDKQKSADLEHDQTMLDKLVDGLATSWVNSSNYKVSCALEGTLIGGWVTLLDQNWSLEKKSFVSNQLDSLASYKTLSQVVAFGHFIVLRVEFALIFVGDKKKSLLLAL